MMDVRQTSKEVSKISLTLTALHEAAGTLPTNHIQDLDGEYAHRARKTLGRMRDGENVRWLEVIEVLWAMHRLSIQEMAETIVNYEMRGVR